MNEIVRVDFEAEVFLGNDRFYIHLPKKINWKKGDVVSVDLKIEKVPGESEEENGM